MEIALLCAPLLTRRATGNGRLGWNLTDNFKVAGLLDGEFINESVRRIRLRLVEAFSRLFAYVGLCSFFVLSTQYNKIRHKLTNNLLTNCAFWALNTSKIEPL